MDYKSIAEWALGRSTGASATCIAQHMIGLKPNGLYPHDGGDFGRCEALLDAVPEFRDRLHEMADVNVYWARLVPRWDEIKSSKDQFRLIQSIVRPVEDEDPNHVRISDSMSLRVGR